MSAPPKRSLFNKPAWSNPSKIGGADDLFHRSNQTYVKLAAEAEERRKKKLAKLQRQRESEKALEGPPGKRRCVSDDSDDGSDSSSSEEKPHHAAKEKVHLSRSHAPAHREAGPSDAVEPTSVSEGLTEQPDISLNENNPNPKIAKASFPSPPRTIDLEEQTSQSQIRKDDELEITMSRISRPAEDDGLPLSDEEFPELARKAREMARRKRLEAESAPASQDSFHVSGDDVQFSRSDSLRAPTPECPPPNPAIEILLTSSIPNTVPLIVTRKISQRLKEVRLAWCARQHFSPEFTATVFLTWRGNRLFDVTTCKSLGIAVDPGGDILLKGRKDVMGEQGRKIHMEATTEEILAEHQRSKRRTTAETVEDDSQVEEVAPVVKEKEPQVRIILKARGYEDFKLIVKPVRTNGSLCYCSLLMAFSLRSFHGL